jgi:hypothetical protein
MAIIGQEGFTMNKGERKLQWTLQPSVDPTKGK